MAKDPDFPNVNKKITEDEADNLVSPETTEKLYGLKAIQPDPPASNPGEIEYDLPEDTDGVAEENTFPSAD